MLKQLDEALLAHFQTILQSINSELTSDRMALTLVDDERHDFLLIESNRAGFVELNEEDEARVTYPFAILFRDILSHTEWNNHGSRKNTTQNIVIAKDTGLGTARIIQAMPLDLTYKLKIYHDNFEVLSDMVEFWLLNAGNNFVKVSFPIPEADNNPIDASIALEAPEPINRVLEESRETGLLFSQSFPMTIRTTLVGDAEDAKIILTNVTTKTII